MSALSELRIKWRKEMDDADKFNEDHGRDGHRDGYINTDTLQSCWHELGKAMRQDGVK